MTVRGVDFAVLVERWGLLAYTEGRLAESNAVKCAWFPVPPSGHCLISLFLPFQLQFAPLGELHNQRAGWTKGKHHKGLGLIGGNGALNPALRWAAGGTKKEYSLRGPGEHWLFSSLG